MPPLDGALVGRLLGEGSASAAAVRKPRSETRALVFQPALERTRTPLRSAVCTVFRCTSLYSAVSAALVTTRCPESSARYRVHTPNVPSSAHAHAHAHILHAHVAHLGAGLGGRLARWRRRPSQLRGLEADSALRLATADSVNGVSSHLSAVNRLILLSDSQGGGAAVRLLPCPGHAHDMSETCPAGGAAAQLLRSLRSLASREGAREATARYGEIWGDMGRYGRCARGHGECAEGKKCGRHRDFFL